MGASNSLRISQELFSAARDFGEAMSRSAAQQVEHWARLGAALERAGLTVEEALALLRERGRGDLAQTASVQELWRRKRAAQSRDLSAMAEGRATWQSMSWFSRDEAQSATMLNGPY